MTGILPRKLTFEVVKQRFDRAMKKEAEWRDLLEDVYEYFLPQRNIFNEESPGQKKMERIYDSTALQAIQEGASRMQENIAPLWKRWAKAELSDLALRELEEIEGAPSPEEIQKNLDKNNEIVFDYLNRSNFGTQFYEMLLDLLVGTGTLRIDEEDDLEMPFSFHAIAPKGIAYEEAPDGVIRTHWRKFEVKLSHVERKWPGFKLNSQLKEKLSREPESMVEVCEGMVYDFESRKYYGVAWVKDDKSLSWEQDYGTSSPWITGRFAKTAGEVRGRGPAMQVYPDVRSLNKAKEFVLQKAAIDLAGMWTATDDGVTNPYNITISPGVVIPVGSNNSSNPSIMRLDTSSNLQLAQFEIAELQMAIKRAFFNDLRDPTGPVRSATEIAIEARELAKRIGSAFGRLQTEVLMPILKRVYEILYKKGIIDFPLDNIRNQIKFTSPLAAAQDQEDLISIQQAVEFTVMTAGPEMAKVSFNQDKFGAFAAKLTGMPQELVSSEQERAQKLQAGQEMAMAQMQAGQKPQEMPPQ